MRFYGFDFSLRFGTDRRRDLLQIQWFVVIACVYLLVAQDDHLAEDPMILIMLLAPFTAMLVFLRLPENVFMHRLFPQIMAVVDTVLLSMAILSNRQSPWDLCLVFFFGILIAAIGENLLQIIGGCLVAGILSILIIPASRGGSFEIDGNTLLRIPLLFGAALVYGYLADQVKRERRQAAEALESRRQQLLMKDQLLSNVSHELRTPLTAVYQFVTILLDEIAGELNSEQKEYLGIALRNVKQLQAMVGDLVEAARADGGKLAIHPRGVSLARLMYETAGSFLTNMRARSITLAEDIPEDLPLVHVDPQRLKQVLTNLIDNAIKFTPENGRISVRARHCEDDESLVRISVTDTGCGISADNARRIFDRLYQEERALATNRKGLGLGLHIAKELVLRHGGQIWVDSEMGKGSTFHFTLPIYSLKRSLRFLVESTASFQCLFVVGVELRPEPTTPGDVIKAIRDVAWVFLSQMDLSDQTVLLPDIVPSGHAPRFYLVNAKDPESCNRLAMRIEKELAEFRQLRNANCRIKTGVWTLDLPSMERGTEVDALTRQLDTCITRAIPQLNLDTLKIESPQPRLAGPNSAVTSALAS